MTVYAQKLGPLVQLGFVVPDLNAAIEAWLTRGVGPFFELSHVDLTETLYRGEPTTLDMSVAFAYAGDTQIELIEQHDASPSVYRDFLRARPSGGLHHIAHLCDDFDTVLATTTPLQLMTSKGSGRFAYFEPDALTGHYLELLEATPPLRMLFAHAKGASVSWDGTAPRRKLR